MSGQQLTMLFEPDDESGCVGRAVPGDEIADIDQVAFCALGKAQLRHNSLGRKLRLQSDEDLPPIAHSARSQIVESGLQISLQRCKSFWLAFRRLHCNRKARLRCWRFRKAVKNPLGKLRGGDFNRERLGGFY